MLLTFHGVDTFASVSLGEQLLGTTENMFVRYRYDVKQLVRDTASDGTHSPQPQH